MKNQQMAQIAKHFRQVYFGGNWTASNFKAQLEDVTWQQATTKVGDLNTIVTLVFHIHYYVTGVLKVFKGGALETKDEYSFNHPPIHSAADWEAFLNQIWDEAEAFAQHLENLSDEQLFEDFVKKEYGNYYRNLNGIVEHTHYHLGQIAIVKKMLNGTK